MSEKRLDDRYSTPERFTTNKGIHAEAHKRLSEVVWNYLNCGTGDEITMRANTADFDRPRYKTPLFAGISNPDTSTTFLGHSLAFPALIAPFGGGEHLFHEDGHIATGRAAAAVGVRQIVPIAAAHSLEAIAEATGVAQMFQVTFVGEVDSVLQISERAKTAGYEQIVATYSPIRQWRERLIEDRFQITGPGGDANYGEGKSDVGMLREQLDFTQPRWGWEKAKEVFKASPLPIIMKGVMTAEEATQYL